MVVNRQNRFRVVQKPLRAFAARLARALQIEADAFTVALVSDREITRLNGRFRGLAKPTDVLAFPSGNGTERNEYRGDVVLSVEMARRNAARHGHGLGEEIKLLTLHGVLHLLGYDHASEIGRASCRERV